MSHVFDDWPDDDEPTYDESAEEDECSKCSCPTLGEQCAECGADLCPMCFSTGGGFCSNCPTECYQPWIP